jgi:hypothetical protein
VPVQMHICDCGHTFDSGFLAKCPKCGARAGDKGQEAAPVSKVNDDSQIVARAGRELKIKGKARHVQSGTRIAVDSLVPVSALTHAALTRQAADTAAVTLRVWDGESYAIDVRHNRSSEVITGLQSVVAEVAVTNATWPMSAARAMAARTQCSPGFLRDSFLLGQQGKDEFWSPLSELASTWAQRWAKSKIGSRWPIAAVDAQAILLLLLDDSIVALDKSAYATAIPFEQMAMPEVIVSGMPAPEHASLETAPSLMLRIGSTTGTEINAVNVSVTDLQPLFRFLIMRWAETQILTTASLPDLLASSASDLADGRLTAVAYAALVDAAVASASGISLSREFPPRERDYLRQTPTTQTGSARQSSAAARPTGPAQQSRSGVNPRQVAAGAAAGAALWSFFSD